MRELTSVDEVVAAISDLADTRGSTGGITIVGISGAPGAGKSTVADEIVAALGDRASLLPMDGFHLPQATLVALGRRERMGAPDTFDVSGFVALLHRLREVAQARPADYDAATSAATTASTIAAAAAHTVLAPGFDRTIEEAVPDAITLRVRPGAIIVVEGNYLLHSDAGWASVAPLLDLRLHLALDRDERLRRLIARHERFGKAPDDARAWAEGPDEANARLIEADARGADATIRLPS